MGGKTKENLFQAHSHHLQSAQAPTVANNCLGNGVPQVLAGLGLDGVRVAVVSICVDHIGDALDGF